VRRRAGKAAKIFLTKRGANRSGELFCAGIVRQVTLREESGLVEADGGAIEMLECAKLGQRDPFVSTCRRGFVGWTPKADPFQLEQKVDISILA
jgi:hypothetical protein